MKIEFENSIRRWSFLCRLLDIKVAWINSCGETFKVPFAVKQVPGSLTREALCFELVNSLCQINPVRNNAVETVPIKLKQCQKEKSP